jgi:hypothetical protein
MLLFVVQGFTHPVRAHFLEDVLEMTGYKLSSFNEDDDYLHVAGLNNITDIVKVCSWLKSLVFLHSWELHLCSLKM